MANDDAKAAARPKVVLRMPEVRRRTGKARSTIYADMEAGRFPKSIKLGGRSVAWLESEIDEWIDAQAARRES